MTDIKVVITGGDRKVGAMVKALAVEVAGFQAVGGTSNTFLSANGFYVFHFPDEAKAHEFRVVVGSYISPSLAQIVD